MFYKFKTEQKDMTVSGIAGGSILSYYLGSNTPKYFNSLLNFSRNNATMLISLTGLAVLNFVERCAQANENQNHERKHTDKILEERTFNKERL